jgi:hypothetical protein
MKSVKIIISLVLVGCALVYAYRRGRRDVLISDFKTYSANTVALKFSNNYSADLKDFLKGRYYFCANRVPNDILKGSEHDYGPASTNSSLVIGKGPTTPQWEYQVFTNRVKTL